MAGYAGFCTKFGACLEKSRLKKSMHRVGILIAGMTTGALLVTDGGVAKRGVGGTQFEPELNFGLELLAHGSGRGLPNIHVVFAPLSSQLERGRKRLFNRGIWVGNRGNLLVVTSVTAIRDPPKLSMHPMRCLHATTCESSSLSCVSSAITTAYPRGIKCPTLLLSSFSLVFCSFPVRRLPMKRNRSQHCALGPVFKRSGR